MTLLLDGLNEILDREAEDEWQALMTLVLQFAVCADGDLLGIISDIADRPDNKHLVTTATRQMPGCHALEQ